MIIANTRKRIQAISIEGSVADRYFAVTSEVPRNTVDSRISAMPLNGRSARAGARRSAGFFAGNGNSSLSSLAAVARADGGLKVELGAINESAGCQKSANDRDRQHPKTGCRYAPRGQVFTMSCCNTP